MWLETQGELQALPYLLFTQLSTVGQMGRHVTKLDGRAGFYIGISISGHVFHYTPVPPRHFFIGTGHLLPTGQNTYTLPNSHFPSQVDWD